MTRTCLIIVIWAVLVAPALCSTGVFEHGCDCAGIGGCGHEGGCPDDPCSLLTSEHVLAGRVLKPSLSFLSLLFTPTLEPIALLASAHGILTRAPGLRSQGDISFPPSDIPLRI
jgi:hypothetical protein